MVCTTASWTCRTIQPLVEDVLKSDTATGGWGPFGWDANQVVDMLRVSVEGINRIGLATTRELTDARDRLRAPSSTTPSRGSNQPSSSLRPQFRAADPGHAHRTLVFRDLVAQVGMEMLAKEESQQLPPAPSIDWPHPRCTCYHFKPTWSLAGYG